MARFEWRRSDRLGIRDPGSGIRDSGFGVRDSNWALGIGSWELTDADPRDRRACRPVPRALRTRSSGRSRTACSRWAPQGLDCRMDVGAGSRLGRRRRRATRRPPARASAADRNPLDMERARRWSGAHRHRPVGPESLPPRWPSAAPARRTHARPPSRAGWPRMDSPTGTRPRLILHGRAYTASQGAPTSSACCLRSLCRRRQLRSSISRPSASAPSPQ